MEKMEGLEIFFDYEDDSVEVAELNEWKGYRYDVKILKDGEKYILNFYRSDALIYKINRWEETKSWDFVIDGITILQDDLDNESIRKRIYSLVAAGYFKRQIGT